MTSFLINLLLVSLLIFLLHLRYLEPMLILETGFDDLLHLS